MTENQRKWAIEEIETNILPDACDEVAERALVYAIEALSQLERPKGRWETDMHTGVVGAIEFDTYFYSCSECGQVDWNNPNFCPNCGADMRGEEE